jgi:L-threonylcarbamoyladenylate synthase
VHRAARCSARARSPWQEKNGQEDRRQDGNEEKDQKESKEKGSEEEDQSGKEKEQQGLVMYSVLRAADVLLRGGVVAYPTEGVYGLGCLPDDQRALERILDIKQRGANKGLILIAANANQLEGWVDLPDDDSLPVPDPSHPVTWIVPPGSRVTPLLRGAHETIAVRITTNSTAKALCEATASPLVSTSANLSGKLTARNRYVLQRQFGRVVDYIVPGDCGPAAGPSEIRDFTSGKVLRPRST